MTGQTTTMTREISGGTLYIDDLFLHARGCSRSLTVSSELLALCLRHRLAQRDTDVTTDAFDPFTAIVDHENAVSEFLARVAPTAVAQWRTVEAIAPGYESDLAELEPPAVDALMRPIFEASGIADDFMPWRERFPNYERDQEESAAAEVPAGE